MMAFSFPFVLAALVCLFSSGITVTAASSPFRRSSSLFGIRSRGGAIKATSSESVDSENTNASAAHISVESEPIVDLVRTDQEMQRGSLSMTVPKIGAAAAALYGVADIGSRIIVNTSGATAPVVIAAGAAASLITGVWAGGRSRPVLSSEVNDANDTPTTLPASIGVYGGSIEDD